MAQNIKATLIMQDSYKDIYRKELETRTTVLATAQAAVDDFLAVLSPCTDLEVLSVTYSYRDATQVLAGELDSNRDIGATFTGLNTDGETVVLKIPGWPSGLVGPQRVIDIGSGTVSALLESFQAAGSFYISDGEIVSSWLKGTLDK